nr:helitron helicase-like domain-containing protein [Tanacetum cinerariifolium]
MASSEEGHTAKRFWDKFKKESVLTLYTPFVVSLASGNLKIDTFRHFLAQDLHFYKCFAQAYELAEDCADDDDAKLSIVEFGVNGMCNRVYMCVVRKCEMKDSYVNNLPLHQSLVFVDMINVSILISHLCESALASTINQSHTWPMWDHNNTPPFEKPTSSLVTAMLVTVGIPLLGPSHHFIGHHSECWNLERKCGDTRCESSTAAVSKRIPYCNMDLLPYSQANALESGQVVLDFASSAVLIPLTDGRWSCEHCKAKFWYGERLKGYSKDQQSHYHKCCSRGKVILEDEREPPEYIKQLFGYRNFLEHIRAYNQMFSMTSFGARVDETKNTRRGPYVFKIIWPNLPLDRYSLSLCWCSSNNFATLLYDTENEITNIMRHFGGCQSDGLNKHTVEGLMRLLDECNELVRLFRPARDKCNGQQILDFKIRLYSVVGAKEYDLPTSQTLGAIVFENGQITETDYDVIIESKNGFA